MGLKSLSVTICGRKSVRCVCELCVFVKCVWGVCVCLWGVRISVCARVCAFSLVTISLTHFSSWMIELTQVLA